MRFLNQVWEEKIKNCQNHVVITFVILKCVTKQIDFCDGVNRAAKTSKELRGKSISS